MFSNLAGVFEIEKKGVSTPKIYIKEKKTSNLWKGSLWTFGKVWMLFSDAPEIF